MTCQCENEDYAEFLAKHNTDVCVIALLNEALGCLHSEYEDIEQAAAGDYRAAIAKLQTVIAFIDSRLYQEI